MQAFAGLVETTGGKRFDGTVTFDEQGLLTVVSSNGVSTPLKLDQVRVARLNPPLMAADSLPHGWRIEDIGDVRGSSVEKDGIQTLRVMGGRVRDPKDQMAHFNYRVLRTDGEAMARVDRVESSTRCLAGVMLRENLQGPGGYALLGVSPDRRLHLHIREGGWKNIQARDLGEIQLPVWLKLTRQQKEEVITAYRSGNGADWEKVGQGRLACRTEPFPEGSHSWKPRFYAGTVLTGSGLEPISTAQLSHVAITAWGLLGEYFADDRFRRLAFARPDAPIDCGWGLDSPGPDIQNDHFSVRWTGKIKPGFTENYRFYFDADNDAELWVDGQPVPQVAFKKEKDKEYRGKELSLEASKLYDIRFEFKEGAGAASVRLGWGSKSQPPEIIPPDHLRYTYGPDSPDEDGVPITNAFLARGIWLRNGSFIAQDVLSSDDTVTRFLFAGGVDCAIPSSRVARIVFRNSRRPLSLETAAGRTGVFLRNGDFLESEVKELKGRSLIVDSVLFGRRSFWLDNPDAIALVLHDCVPQSAPWQVTLVDGSVLRVGKILGKGKDVVLEDPVLGRISLSETELLEIRASPANPADHHGS